MEISNNTNSVLLDIDKLTFKKDGVDNFVMNLQPGKESTTNTNVLKSTAPLETNDIYLTQLNGPNKSVLTKMSNIDTSFNSIDASLIDLYNNSGGAFSGAANSLNFGSSSINLPSIIGTDGQALLYNGSSGTFAWGQGSGSSNVLTFGNSEITLPSALGITGQVLAFNGASDAFYWADRTSGGGSGGVDAGIFDTFVSSIDDSFNIINSDIERIDASINSRIDISLDEIKVSLSNATNNNYYSTAILDGSFMNLSTVMHDISNNVNDISNNVNDISNNVNDISNLLDDFRTSANSNFSIIIQELSTTSDKFDTTDSRFVGVNANFNAFDYIINDICNNLLKKSIDNSNSLLFGTTHKTLPTTFGTNNQVLISNGTELTWAAQTGTSNGSTYDDAEIVTRLNNIDASFVLVDASFVLVDASFVLVDASFDNIDLRLIDISNTFDNNIVRIDQSLNTLKSSIASNLSTINSNYSTHLTNHNSLSSTVTILSNNVTQNSTHINDLTNSVTNSVTNLSGSIDDLSNNVLVNKNSTQNSINIINRNIDVIDNSLTTIKSNIIHIEQDVVNLDSFNVILDASINELNTSVNGVIQTTTNLNTNITNLNNKKSNYLDTQDGLTINMPVQRPTGKTLVVSSDPSKFEWATVKEITKESDVNLLNLNVYGSTDVSGNIRVSDEIIVGMTDATESIRTKGSIKTNNATLHQITFPSNLDHPQRIIDISQQNIYHDVSGIHLTKTVLHDVDISGTVNIMPTNSIITPLGVTIKFL